MAGSPPAASKSSAGMSPASSVGCGSGVPKSSSLPGASKASAGRPSSEDRGLSNASGESDGASSNKLRRFGWEGVSSASSSGDSSSIASSSIASSAASSSSGVPGRSKASASSIVSATGSSVAVSAVASPCTVFGSHGSRTEAAGASAGAGWVAAEGSLEVVAAAVPGSSSSVGLSGSGPCSSRVIGTGAATGCCVVTISASPPWLSSAGVGMPITPSSALGASVPITVPSEAMPLSAIVAPWQGSHRQSPPMNEPSSTSVPSARTVPSSTIDPSTGPVVIHVSRTTSAGGAVTTANGAGAPSGRSSMTMAPAQPGNGTPAPHGGAKAGPRAKGLA